MDLNQLKLIYVEWTDHDSRGQGPWLDVDDALEEAKAPITVMKTVGWLLYETEDTVALVGTICPSLGGVGSAVERILKVNIQFRRDDIYAKDEVSDVEEPTSEEAH